MLIIKFICLPWVSTEGKQDLTSFGDDYYILPRIESKTNVIPGVIEDLDIFRIKPPKFALRTNLTNIEQLAHSIREKGLLQPIVVRADNTGSFEIVAGHRRYCACKSLGWRKIPCHIIELDNKEAFEIALIENMQRKTLSSVEEGMAFKKYVSDFGWGGVSELARKIGRSHTYIIKRIKLLDLPEDVIRAIERSVINTSVAEELLKVGNKAQQSRLSELISKRNLSLRQARNLVINNLELDSTISQSPNETETSESEMIERVFDKVIISLRSSMSKLVAMMDKIEDNWMAYEILMQHRSMLHSQIDLLIKQKKKFIYI